jgi:PST family polysaccharide transporter
MLELQEIAETIETHEKDEGTYGQILKSTVLVGGATVVGIVIRIVRTKAMALLLGPAGFGLFGLYGTIESLAENIAGVGVSSSGVRQIAAAVGSGDSKKIARTVAVLRRTSIALGILGALFLIVLSRPISVLTFGGSRQSSSICLLSLAVVFQLISYGQDALIQGMRRISDLAEMSVLGAIIATVVSVPIVYIFRSDGVVLSLVIVAAMTVLTSWLYSRRVRIPTLSITSLEVFEEAKSLLKLGSVFMMGALLLTGVAYFVRTLILHRSGLEAAGLYQSAWTAGGLYVGLIIQAMAADFYPRLSASAGDDSLCNRLVNEQARVGLLLACPGVIATLSLAPIVTVLLYSAKFNPAVDVLRWIALGTTVQVITWPMGFIVVAKNCKRTFFWCELVCAGVYAFLAWLCVDRYGLIGAGFAFFAYCVFHGLLHYPIVRSISGFRWSKQNIEEGLVFSVLIAAVYWSLQVVPLWIAAGVGTLVAIASGVYSVRVLVRLAPSGKIPKSIGKLMAKLRLVQAA